MKIIIIIGLITTACFGATAKSNLKWQGTIPEFANDASLWKELLSYLVTRQMYYGALASASRMLVFFTDLPTKEFAYKTIIDLIDKGYPYSVGYLFTAGDIDPVDPKDFRDNYNFYKGVLSEEKGMSQWATYFFSQVDKENFSKYLFSRAIKSYEAGKIDEARELLEGILKKQPSAKEGVLFSKVARTLARIYHEKEQYDKSLDIYRTYLLKLNPMHPSDWVEASWDLYFLKRYEEALGMLYNLEAKSSAEHLILDKYVLRALIYQVHCSTSHMSNLIKSFDRDLGKTITSIKRGETYNKLNTLRTIEFSVNTDYHQALNSVKELYSESKLVKHLPEKFRVLAEYLYSSESSMWKSRLYSLEEPALERVAIQLVNMSESLRFLKFDVARGKFNTDDLFSNSESESGNHLLDNGDGFQIRWLQKGEFWRDERQTYKGILFNRCSS